MSKHKPMFQDDCTAIAQHLRSLGLDVTSVRWERRNSFFRVQLRERKGSAEIIEAAGYVIFDRRSPFIPGILPAQQVTRGQSE